MRDPEGDEVDELVMDAIARIEEHGLGAFDDLCREHPGHAAALRARVRTLAESGMLAEPGAPPARLGDFVLGRRLGGGGMGVVYAAVQESLGREVALKVVRADQLYFPGSKERFRREGRLVARLSHAGIVPVHAVGEEGGVPYLAMERMRGATLAEALAALGRPPRDGRDLADAVARVVETREGGRPEVGGPVYEGDGVDVVLRVARDVALALAHAHGRGVLHRDLKASNVMLTVDGRALLFDFGLAHSTDGERFTRSGARVGSLPYMAPEQVRGEPVDERTDVYGLGAMLCEALTARPPHEGTPDVVAAAVLRGDPVPLRARRRELSRDVETIVLTALASDPARRYAGAPDLARDLSHALARRPIEARPSGPALRVLRWAQRHPARAAVLLLAVAAPAALAVQQALAGRRVADEARRAERQAALAAEERDRAEDNLDRALEALDPLLEVLDAGVLDQVPHVDAARVALLEDALAALGPLLAQRPDDPRLARRALHLGANLGSMLTVLGRYDDAEEAFRLAQSHEDVAAVEAAEGIGAWNGLGGLLERTGRFAEACRAFETASARLAAPSGWERLAAKGSIERNVSRLRSRLSRFDDAVEAADAAIAFAERAVAAAADERQRFDARLGLGAALVRRAVARVAVSARQVADAAVDAEARAAYERALPLLLGLVDERPQHAEATHEAAAACLEAERFLAPDVAEAVLARGLELAVRLVRDHPERVDFPRTLVGVEANLGTLVARGGRPARALPLFESAVAHGEAALARAPDDFATLLNAGRADANLASALVELGRPAEAAAPAARARERLARAAGLVAAETFALDVAWATVFEGYGRVALGEHGRARALVDELDALDVADATLAVAAGEILAQCARAEDDATRAAELATRALAQLERGLGLGFARLDYLSAAHEWDGLRDDPRFVALLADAAGRTP